MALYIRFCNFMMYCWCEGLALLLHLNPRLKWDVQGLEGLNKKNWYLLISNHHSWADIVVLCVLFRKHIPMNKYFLKQQLAWVPFIGLACWALDMPLCAATRAAILFVTRSAAVKMSKPPAVRVKNFARIRRLSSILWKARVLPKKKRETRSPYHNLLPPKAAGIAMALNVLGSQFDKLLNVTLCYPDNHTRPFYDMLSGRLTRIVVRINLVPIGEELHGDYVNDKNFKRSFQRWLNGLWEEKDRQLTDIMRDKER